MSEFKEIFEVELECWCYGLQRIREELDSGVVYKVIKEFAPVLRQAIEQLYAFDVIDAAKRICDSSRSKVSEKEIAFYILSQLPSPDQLSEAQRSILKEVVDSVERVYSGAIARLEKVWNAKQNSGAPRKMAKFPASPNFPPKSFSVGR